MRVIIWLLNMNHTNQHWELDDAERAVLLEQFPPVWPDIYAHHVTCGWCEDVSLHDVETGHIVGVVDDGKGLQALVVEINGTVHRPDGNLFHITWSLDKSRGRKPVDSNNVLKNIAWRRIDRPVAIKLLANIDSRSASRR
jgi:hypothetical protein